MTRWEDNIRMDPKQIGVGVNNWMGSVKDKVYMRALLMRIEPADSINHGVNYLSYTN